MIKKFTSFVKGLKKDKFAILYHPDGDGLCAAVIVTKALEKLDAKPALVFTQKPWQISLAPQTRQKLKQKRIKRLLILDMAADQCPSSIAETEKIAKIMIIDHHILSNDVNSAKTLMIKAQAISKLSGDKYPAAKLCYDLFFTSGGYFRSRLDGCCWGNC